MAFNRLVEKIKRPKDVDLIVTTLTGTKYLRSRKMTLSGPKGQHGAPLIFEEVKRNQKWLLKVFPNTIDQEFQGIADIEVDLGRSAEETKHLQHFHRPANEYVASRLAYELGVNVPEAIIVVSKAVNEFNLDINTPLSLGEDIIILDSAEQHDNAEQYYNYQLRPNQKLYCSERFDNILLEQCQQKGYEIETADQVIGVLTRFISRSKNLDVFLDTKGKAFEEKIEKLRSLKQARSLIPFDVWLGGPDRNAGNYLLHTPKFRSQQIFGIDYEMWSFAETDIIEEGDITKGRSYLAAVLHPATSIQDPIIIKSLEKILSLTEQKIKQICRLPRCYVKFVEYQINKGIINPEEREKLRNLEENLKDFLWETKSWLRKKIVLQIGDKAVKH